MFGQTQAARKFECDSIRLESGSVFVPLVATLTTKSETNHAMMTRPHSWATRVRSAHVVELRAIYEYRKTKVKEVFVYWLLEELQAVSAHVKASVVLNIIGS